MKGFGIIGMAAIAGLIGYFCEPALRPVLTPEAKTPAKPVAPPVVVEPAPEKPVPPVVAEPEPPKTEPQEPPPEPTPPVEEPAPVAPEPPPVAEPEVPSEPETPAEPAPAQPEETKPEESVPAPSGKMELPPVKPLALEPPTPITPSPETAETAETSPVIVAMQESFQNDGLREFTDATPTRWQTGTDETVGDETYQTGLLDYLAQTPFGGKAMQVKALLQDGKVVKWVSITSGKELK
jgi:hypothetical protein